MTTSRFQSFQDTIWEYYRKNKRVLPWRNINDPYRVFISEIMLQQTQVIRVIPKYTSFLKKFPNFKSLARAPLREVLSEWKGLGYNRRGLNLKRAAEIIVEKHNGKVPRKFEELVGLPGIGPHTAGSILAFAYNIPIAFIETNIRSVFIHFFFKDKENIQDKEILKLVEKTIPEKMSPKSGASPDRAYSRSESSSREWYYALMDYGSMLKKTSNPSQKSRHYTKQSTFKGSHRELRAKILSSIVELEKPTLEHIVKQTGIAPIQTNAIIVELSKEGFIVVVGKRFRIT